MQALKSSNLSGASYDEKSRTLTISFTSGSTYRYSGVPKETYENLLAAPSAGSFFYRWVRDAYPVERVS